MMLALPDRDLSISLLDSLPLAVTVDAWRAILDASVASSLARASRTQGTGERDQSAPEIVVAFSEVRTTYRHLSQAWLILTR